MAAVVSLDKEKEKAVLRQVEFYFSDSNLPKDNFLKKSVQESEDGLVSLALICSFSRMRAHLGLGAAKPEEMPEETVQAVAETLRKSSSLRVSDDGKRIGRSSELQKPEDAEQVDSRTVAVAPLPYDVKIEDLESLFGQHGKVNSVRLPRHVTDKRHFCGTALIEFSEEEDAKLVLKESLVYAGAELEIKPKKDFDAEREKKSGEFEKNDSNKNASNGSYTKGLIVAFKLKSMPTEGSAEQNDAEACKTEVSNSTGSVNEREQKNDNKDEKSSENVEKDNEEKAAESDLQDTEEKATDNASQESKDKVAKSSTVESGGKKDNSVVTREDLKAVFQKFGTVKYIDYFMGGESGFIRFEDPEAAAKARATAVLNDLGGLVVKNFIASLEALTGDAEKEYWSQLRGHQDRWRDNKNNRGRGGRNNRGGRHFNGKRSRQRDSAAGQSNKVQKVESDA